MTTREINRLREMEVFVRVVELSGFSAAGRALTLTPSAVSKVISRLEARLGVRLFNRSTRELRLTPEGQHYFEHAQKILDDVDEAERRISAGDRPFGTIRINTSASYGTHVLAPLVPLFMDTYPDIELDLVQTDRLVDLVAERTDVAIRAGPLKSSSLMARKLGETPLLVVASPDYIKRKGMPLSPDDLSRYELLSFDYARAVRGWPFRVDGAAKSFPVRSRIQASDGEALRTLALNGAGITRLSRFTVADDIANLRLVVLLAEFDAGEREPFHAVYVGQGGQLPARVRILLDFLAERGRIG